MLRQLMDALGLFTGARPETPETLWNDALQKVRTAKVENARLREALLRTAIFYHENNHDGEASDTDLRRCDWSSCQSLVALLSSPSEPR